MVHRQSFYAIYKLLKIVLCIYGNKNTKKMHKECHIWVKYQQFKSTKSAFDQLHSGCLIPNFMFVGQTFNATSSRYTLRYTHRRTYKKQIEC